MFEEKIIKVKITDIILVEGFCYGVDVWFRKKDRTTHKIQKGIFNDKYLNRIEFEKLKNLKGNEIEIIQVGKGKYAGYRLLEY